MVLFSRCVLIPRSQLSSHAPPPPEPRPDPETQAREAAELLAWRVQEKAKVYIAGGMPKTLALPRAYRALTEPFDSKWGRKMMSARAHAAKRRKRAAALAAKQADTATSA